MLWRMARCQEGRAASVSHGPTMGQRTATAVAAAAAAARETEKTYREPFNQYRMPNIATSLIYVCMCATTIYHIDIIIAARIKYTVCMAPLRLCAVHIYIYTTFYRTHLHLRLDSIFALAGTFHFASASNPE